MTSSPVSADSSPSRPLRTGRLASQRRLSLLATVLVCLALLLPISRHYLFSKPPPPPDSAGLRAKMRYYAARIEKDPADVSAYSELGRLDSATGYYTDALKHLYAARALGAKDQEIALPLGHALTYLAHYAEARAELDKAIVLLPHSLQAVIERADLALVDNNPHEASKLLRDYADRNPDVVSGTASPSKRDVERLMHYFLQAQDQEMGYKMAQTLLRLAPDQPDGYAVAGKIELARGDKQKALETLRKAWERSPNDAVSCYMYGVALIKNNNEKGNEEEALKQWRKTVVLDPKAMDAYYYLAETYTRRKDYRNAAATMQIIALNNMTDPNVVRSTIMACDKAGQKIGGDYWRAIEAQLHKNYPASLNYARTVVNDPVWHNRGLAVMGQAYRRLNRMDDYLAVIRQLTARHTPEEELTLANAYGTAERLTEQTQTLQEALARNPPHPAQIHLLLSQVAMKKGLRPEAEAEMEQAVALEPKNPLYYRELGRLYYERRNSGDRLQRAIRAFEQLIRLDPNEVSGYQMLGLAYADEGDLHRSALNLEHALDLLPGDGVTYQTLARVYAGLGDKAGSEQMRRLYRLYVSYELQQKSLQTKSRAAQKDPASQVALAEFLERSGDYAGAARYYRLAYALRPTDSALKAKVEHIRTLLPSEQSSEQTSEQSSGY